MQVEQSEYQYEKSQWTESHTLCFNGLVYHGKEPQTNRLSLNVYLLPYLPANGNPPTARP